MTHSVKKQLFRDTAKYISSQYVAQAFGFVTSFTMKRFLGPTLIGVWNIVLLVISYCSFMNLGTSDVAYRDIPFYKGSKQFGKAEKLKNEAFTFSLITSVVPAIGIVLYAIFFRNSFKETYLFATLIYTAVFLICQKTYNFYTTLLRANSEFTIISQVTILAAAFNLLLTFLLIWPFKLPGLFAAAFLNVLLPFWFMASKTRYHFRLTLSGSGLWDMLKIGFPLFALGLCSQTIASVDKLIIVKYLGLTALGNYSIATMAGNYLLGMPNMFCIALYPRLQEKFGEGQTPEHIKHYLLQPIRVVAAIVGFLVGFAVLTVPFLVLHFLPEFSSGIPSMKIFVGSVFFFAIGQHAQTFLVTLNKQLKVIPITVLGILTIGGLGLLFVHWGWGIEGVAWGVLIGSLLYNFTLIAYAKSHFATLKESVRFFIFIAFIFFYFAVATVLLTRIGQDASFFAVIVRTVLYVMLAGPLFWILEKKTGFLKLAVTVIREKYSKTPCVIAEQQNG